MATTTQHVVQIREAFDVTDLNVKTQAVCSCGWESAKSSDDAEVRQAVRDHVKRWRTR